jgi:replicative DNA helicase
MSNLNLKKTERNGKRSWRGTDDSLPENNLIYGYIPPQDKEMEKALLGAMMLDVTAFDTISEILKPEVFYVEAHQEIYRAAMRLSEKSQPVDMLTMVNELKAGGKLESIGGAYYLIEINRDVVSAANIEAHARIILQKFILRELIRIGSFAVKEAFKDEKDVFDLMDEVGAELFTISSGNEGPGSAHRKEGRCNWRSLRLSCPGPSDIWLAAYGPDHHCG